MCLLIFGSLGLRPLAANLFDESSQVAGINAFLDSFHLISRKDISGCLTMSLLHRHTLPLLTSLCTTACIAMSPQDFGWVDFVSANATDFLRPAWYPVRRMTAPLRFRRWQYDLRYTQHCELESAYRVAQDLG
jgi:hypothetical protein